MEFSQEQLRILAIAFGDLARGCKKIKAVLLGAATTESAPPEMLTSDSSDESTGVEEEKGELPPINLEDFNESAIKYLYSPKMLWGKKFGEMFFKHMVRRRMRANKMKFCWIHTGGSLTAKKHWKKISANRAEEIYSRIRAAFSELQTEIHELKKRPENIRKSKWERRQMVLSFKLPRTLWERKGFKKYLVEIHDDLPTLK